MEQGQQASYLFLAALFGVPLLIVLIYRFLTRDRRRERLGQAEVLSKTPELAIGSGMFGNNNWNYKVQFRVGGSEFFLYALKDDYDTLEPGMTGTLTWQEENMLDFIPDTP